MRCRLAALAAASSASIPCRLGQRWRAAAGSAGRQYAPAGCGYLLRLPQQRGHHSRSAALVCSMPAAARSATHLYRDDRHLGASYLPGMVPWSQILLAPPDE